MKVNKILNVLANTIIIIGGICIIADIVTEIYKNINITNKIENPSSCIRINDEYYCKVEEKQEKVKII